MSRFLINEGTRGAYHLHVKLGNSGWKMKWYIPFHLKHFGNYRLSAQLINALICSFLFNFPIDTSAFFYNSILRLDKLQH